MLKLVLRKKISTFTIHRHTQKGYNLSNWKRRRNAEHNSGSLKNFLYAHTQHSIVVWNEREKMKEMEQMLFFTLMSECSFVSAAIDSVPIKFFQPQKKNKEKKIASNRDILIVHDEKHIMWIFIVFTRCEWAQIFFQFKSENWNILHSN